MIQSKISQIFTFKNTTLAVYTLTTAIVLINPSKAFAQNCDETRTVTTPFTWSLTQTTGSGKSSTFLIHLNEGPFGTVEPKEEDKPKQEAKLNGNFEVTKKHNAPAEICSGPTPDLPTEVTLKLTGILSTYYTNTTSPPTYLRVTPNLSLVPDLTEQSFGPGIKQTIRQEKEASKQVGEGRIDYTGSLNVESKFGIGVFPKNFVNSIPSLSISGSLINPITQISYEVPVPEPITIMGSIVTLSFIAGFKNRGKGKN